MIASVPIDRLESSQGDRRAGTLLARTVSLARTAVLRKAVPRLESARPLLQSDYAVTRVAHTDVLATAGVII